MNEQTSSPRGFTSNAAPVAAASAIAAAAVPHVFAAENNTIQIALIGAGGRGSGAAANALSVRNGPIKLVTMADIFPAKLSRSYDGLKRRYGDRADVPEERRFLGFDAYRKAMDCLKPGDVAILTTPCTFRWPMFTYAIQKGINVFMEKPVTPDGPSARKMLALAQQSVQKNMKVGVGLMCRHCSARAELYKRIKDGQIGEILAIRAYRMGGSSATCGPKPARISELRYQIQKFHSFMWSGGGCFMDYLIHNIDECCWMKDAWPVQAQATGARHYRGRSLDQNLDTYAIEYTFPDGTKLMVNARTMNGCRGEFASYAHGSKGLAVISTASHTPAKCRIYKGQNITREDLAWAFPQPEPNPYQLEWDHLIDAIRNDKPYNEVKRGVEASVVTAMGRMAAHTGQIITFDQMLNCEHEFAPGIDQITEEMPAPLQLQDGKYPVPEPGLVNKREF